MAGTGWCIDLCGEGTVGALRREDYSGVFSLAAGTVT